MIYCSSSCKLNDSTLNALLNSHIKEDALCSSSLTPKGESILPALTLLDVSDNFITNFSILSISDTLNGLRSLNISSNRPTKDSFIVFCSKQVCACLYKCVYVYIYIYIYI